MSALSDLIFDDLRTLFMSLYDHAWAIIVMTMLFCTGAFYFLITTPDQYTALSLVMFDPRDSQTEALRRPASLLTDEDKYLLSEIEILRSREIATAVIKDFALHQRPEFNADLPSPSRRHRFLNWLHQTLPPSIIAWLPLPEPTPDFPTLHLDAVMINNGTVTSASDQITAKVYRAFAASLGTRIRGGSRVIEISFRSRDPELAAAVANKLTEEYFSQKTRADMTLANVSTEWIDDRIENLQKEVRDLETALVTAQQSAGILEIGTPSILTQQIEQLTERLTTVSGERAAHTAHAEGIRRSLGQGDYGKLAELVDTPEMTQLKAELSARMSEVNQLRVSLRELHPRLIAAEAQLKTIRDRIQSEALAYIHRVDQNVIKKSREEQDLNDQLSRLRRESASMSQSIADLSAMERNIAAKRDILKSFLEQRAQLAMFRDERAVQNSLRLVSVADVPKEPTGPRRKLFMLIAAAVGMAFGMILALSIDLFTRRLTRRGQVKALVERVMVLGYLPPFLPLWHIWRMGRTKRRRGLFDEAIRRLHSEIALELKEDEKRAGKVVLFTSSQPKEGKTVSAQAIAEVAAKGGQRVLLMDCDPKNAAMRFERDVPPPPGVVDILEKNASLDFAIMASPDIKLLDRIYSGKLTEDNQGLLGGKLMDGLISDLRSLYDLIIIDSPPLISLSYVLSLSNKADLVVFLARWRKVQMRDVVNCIAEFRKHDIPVGVVFTDMPHSVAKKYGLTPIRSYYQAYVNRLARA